MTDRAAVDNLVFDLTKMHELATMHVNARPEPQFPHTLPFDIQCMHAVGVMGD